MSDAPAKMPVSFSEDEAWLILEIDKQPEGLGDSIASLIHKIGANRAEQFYEKLTGLECGCSARCAWLNKWWPYRRSA